MLYTKGLIALGFKGGNEVRNEVITDEKQVSKPTALPYARQLSVSPTFLICRECFDLIFLSSSLLSVFTGDAVR